MILARTYSSKIDIPRGAETLYTPTGNLFILKGAKRDFVADNPWEPENWNLTAQGRFISEHGMTFAAVFAKMAGTVVGGTKPSLIAPALVKQYILTKKIPDSSSGGGIIGAGSSGTGPPQ